MRIIIRKKDFLNAIRQNQNNEFALEFDPKNGKSDVVEGGKEPSKKTLKVIPLPSMPEGTPFTRWTPKSTTEWYQKNGHEVEIAFIYDGLMRGPLKRYGESAKPVADAVKAPVAAAKTPASKSAKPHIEMSPFPPAVVYENLVLSSGQIPYDSENGTVLSGTLEEELEMALQNLDNSLRSAGSGKENILKLTVFVTDIGPYEHIVDICNDFFAKNSPAFSCMEVSGLPHGIKVQLDAVAWI